jgi:hypothetical protein
VISRLGLSQRDRRTLIVGATVVTSLVVFARGMPALRSWEADQVARAQAAMQELAVLRGGHAVLPALRDSVRARQARLAALDSTVLSGASPSAIGAALASALEDLADDNALKISALQLRPDTAAIRGLAHVEVRITGVVDVTGLAGMLRDIEGGQTSMLVRDLSVSQPEPAASDAKAETLHVDMLVAAIGSIKTEPRS